MKGVRICIPNLLERSWLPFEFDTAIPFDTAILRVGNRPPLLAILYYADHRFRTRAHDFRTGRNASLKTAFGP